MKNLFVAIVLGGLMLGSAPIRLAAQCVGDCSGDGEVSVDELVRGVNVALGTADVSLCVAMDSDSSGEVTIDEVITAVNLALLGCSAAAPTQTPTATPTQPSNLPTPTATIFVPGCGNGSVQATFSSPANTNADTSPANLTLVAAGQVRDPRSGVYIWSITGNTCNATDGLLRSVQIQLIGARSGFAPGSYPLNPPLGTLYYLESPATGSVQPRIWQTTAATLVIDSVSGGSLSFHVTNAPMTPNLIVAGDPPPSGTFNLGVSGNVQTFTSN